MALFSKPWLLVAIIVRSSGLGAVIYEPKIQCCDLQADHSLDLNLNHKEIQKECTHEFYVKISLGSFSCAS